MVDEGDYFDFGPPEPERLERLRRITDAIAAVDKLMYDVEDNIRHVQSKIDDHLRSNVKAGLEHKMPILKFMPPYFKGIAGNTYPLTEAGQRKISNKLFDTLHKENKRWTKKEIWLLQESVYEEIRRSLSTELETKRRLLSEKIRNSGQETSRKCVTLWKDEVARIDLRLNHLRTADVSKLDLEESYAKINWNRIASHVFNGIRSAMDCRLRWQNMYSPNINKQPWSEEELMDLYKAYKNKEDEQCWKDFAESLNTDRTAFDVFKTIRTDIHFAHCCAMPWSNEENDLLLYLVDKHKGRWPEVSKHMKGRCEVACRDHFAVYLGELAYLPWSSVEDYKILDGLLRLGPKKWYQISKQTSGKLQLHCRKRWCSELSQRQKFENWDEEEDQALKVGVSVYGDDWGQIAKAFDMERKPEELRERHRLIETLESWVMLAEEQLFDPQRSEYLAQIEEVAGKPEGVPEPPQKGQAVAEDPKEPDVTAENPNDAEGNAHGLGQAIAEDKKEPDVTAENPNEADAIAQVLDEAGVISQVLDEALIIVDDPDETDMTAETPNDAEITWEDPDSTFTIVEDADEKDIIAEISRDTEMSAESQGEAEAIAENSEDTELIEAKPMEIDDKIESP